MGAGAWPARVHGRAPQRIRRPRPKASSAADKTPVAKGCRAAQEQALGRMADPSRSSGAGPLASGSGAQPGGGSGPCPAQGLGASAPHKPSAAARHWAGAALG